jgi:hypothetical protein
LLVAFSHESTASKLAGYTRNAGLWCNAL